ncbi:MAG: hypothetical protein K8R45_07950 [Desulfobacterales bacterium]|nr:hypothetical protein [Desulfobacterales bacterium]
MMNHCKKRPIAFILLCVFFLTATLSPALAQDSEADSEITAASMIGDLFVLRPLGFVATILGTALFIVTLPVTAAVGDTKVAQEKLVTEPGKFTFERPLGKLP